MKHLKKIFESSDLVDYDQFSKEQKYRYSISRIIIKKVEAEIRDEILEFFYSLIDDLTPESELKLHNPNDVQYFTPVRSDIKKNNDTNSWSYYLADDLYDVRGHSSTNTISKTSCDFSAIVRINLTEFDSNSIMSEVKAIYNNIVDSGYNCEYSFNHKLREGNVPRNGYKGEQTQSLDLDFYIRIKGEKVLDRIGVDVNKLTK